MKVLVDMNMSPRWAAFLGQSGFPSVHWATVGHAQADDPDIMLYARERGFVVLTEDLDFGILLALTNGKDPSVVQVRVQISTPERVGLKVLAALHQFRAELEAGAIVTVGVRGHRARVLPFRPLE